MIIGNIELKSNLIFAPIAGFSDVGFRHLCKKYGAGLTVTEMVSAKGLYYNNKGTDALLATTEIESPSCVQLFGSDPEFMYKASKDERLEKFDIIDINMGCPVPKVFNNGDGSALMKNPSLMKEVVEAVKEGSNKAVTCKMRAGVTTGEILAVDCALACEQGGADAITIHPRFRDQYYSGDADHAITRLVKEAVRIPIIASGDIVDATSLKRIKDISKADGFMIARAALGRPYIFSELSGLDYQYSAKECIMEHIKIMSEVLPIHVVTNQIKMHICNYAKGNVKARQIRQDVCKAKTIDDVLEVVEAYFV